MAAGTSNFPTSIDDNGVKDSTTEITSLLYNNHSEQIEAIETKVGVDSSAVATSLDYLVKSASSTNPGHKHPESKITFDTSAGHDHDGTDSKTLADGSVTAPKIDINIGCHAYLSSDQLNIADVTPTKVLLDSETYDLGNNFASNKFTVPTGGAGYYLIIGQISWIGYTADKMYGTQIYVNGSLAGNTIHSIGTSAALAMKIQSSIIKYLSATNYVELYAYHNVGAATPDVDGSASNFDTFLQVQFLST